MEWHERDFADLSVAQLYAIVNLRERVFVVEQSCVYLDADGLDPLATHLWATVPGDAGIRAYLRILPPGAKFAELSLGRVIVAPEARGTGLGVELMIRGIAAATRSAPRPIRIGAQAHLERFYTALGFQRASDNYDEDGIPHLEMLRS